MITISEKEIIKRLQLDNPWWVEGEIDERFSNLPRRDYFNAFYSLLSDKTLNRAVILMGPRRVGKTVMVYHAISRLMDTDVPTDNILYLSLETPVYNGLSLEQLINKFIELKQHERNSNLYIFYDEIQYLKNWEIHLKSLVDTYPDYKFIVTGSAAAALKLKSQESGAGRFTDFLLPPLTFAEFLRFIDRENELINTEKTTNHIEALNQEFINYLNYGGYPEAVFSRTIQKDSERYIKSDIIDKVLLRDLPSLYGIADIQELNRLFTTIAYNTGNEVNYEELSQSSGVAKNTLKKYIEYLQAAFLIRLVKRVDQNAKRFKRMTTFKVYLTNPSMRAALFGAVSDTDEAMGSLVETAIFSQWLHSRFSDSLYYARWKSSEVDIVALAKDLKPLWATEIKWTDLPVKDHRKIKGLIAFGLTNAIEQVSLTSKTQQTTINKETLKIDVVPSAIKAYWIGKNILENQDS